MGQKVLRMGDQVKLIADDQMARNPLAKQKVALDAMAVMAMEVALEGSRAKTSLQLEWRLAVK